MQHIVQIAFDFDDEAVTRKVEANAEQVIMGRLETAVMNRLFTCHFLGHDADPKRDPLSAWAKERFDAFLDAHKAEIIRAAGEYLGEKLARTKAGKAALEQAGGGQNG